MAQKDDILSAYTVIFEKLFYLGPGDEGLTRHVLERLRTDLPTVARVADFGCGVGASALTLAHSLPQARVLAVDSHAPFVERVQATATARGLGKRLSAVVGDMARPPALDGVTGGLDLIWSESAIYSIGRRNAFGCWRPLFTAGGWLVFSEIVWNSDSHARSKEITTFWDTEYPDITTADAVVAELTGTGFDPLEPVVSGRRAWSNYYEPLRKRLRVLAKSPNRSQALIDVMAEIDHEIAIYDRTQNEVALTFFVARRSASEG
jgi:SAM-dependent methyltransferase